jgi:3'-phosphoadenosine 5'-phosphosulfate sulfotransferase (PAPS reductase)/FAD synthetase
MSGGADVDLLQPIPAVDLIDQARAILDQVIAEHQPSHMFALFSGGHDSLVSTHLTAQHPRFSAVVHINTGIGIEETREFVRRTCERHGWPLLEYRAREGLYEERCLKWGMPGGPKHHEIMYHLLKGDQIQRLIRDHKRGRRDRIALVTGVRHSESARRMRLHPTPVRQVGARVWVNPILKWTGIDVSRYVDEHGLERNPVVDKLHRSGECLCGALSDPAELDWIAFWYPDVAARIRNLERQCYERGLPYRWGATRVAAPDPRQPMLPLCHSCQTKWDLDDAGRWRSGSDPAEEAAMACGGGQPRQRRCDDDDRRREP